jgi:virginiamycin B lyase
MVFSQWRRKTASTSQRRRPSRFPSRVSTLQMESLEDRCLLSLSPFHQFPLPTPAAEPLGITAGPDAALWFTETAAARIGQVTLDGVVTEFAVGVRQLTSTPERITSGPDGALWFTDPGANRIGRMTTDGDLTVFAVPSSAADLQGITSGPDGAVWFTEQRADKIGRIDPDGTLTEYGAPWATRPNPSGFHGIVAGSDGALWVTEESAHAIARVTTGGLFTEYPLPSGNDPLAITAGPDGALWFTESSTQIGRITTGGDVTEYGLLVVNSFYGDITAGPDGAVWFLVNNTLGASQLGRITPTGTESFIDVPAPFGLGGITTGPDGTIWFTETAGNAVGQLMLAAGHGIQDQSASVVAVSIAPLEAASDAAVLLNPLGATSLPAQTPDSVLDLSETQLSQPAGLQALPISAALSAGHAADVDSLIDSVFAGSNLADVGPLEQLL